MRIKSARRAVRRLVVMDALRRLSFRFAAWLGAAFAVWALTLLSSLCLLDTRLMPSPLAFNAILMAAVGSLPAFLAYPARLSWGMDAVRAVDGEAAIEAWLGYHGGPAERLLERRALEALGLAMVGGPRLPARSAAARRSVVALFGLGLAALAAAQVLSIRSGCGLSLGYPERAIAQDGSELPAAWEDPYRSLVEAEAAEAYDAPPEDKAADPLPSRHAGEADEGRLEEPDFVAAADGRSGDGPADGDGVAPDAAKAAGRSGDGAGSSRRGAASADGGDGRGEGSGGEATSPGYEGRGRAIEPSPMVDYRARFESQFVDATGVETVIGPEPSAETVSAAIAELFSSYDANVIVGRTMDPELAGLGAAWLEAFGPGYRAAGEGRP